MSVNKTVFVVSTGLIILTALVYFIFKKKQDEFASKFSTEINIEQTWNLPASLREVSGIAYLENNRVACVQDENGVLFIYNLESSTIEEQIEFAGEGDFEGIAVEGTTAYIVQSDGTIYRIADFENNPEITEHPTGLTSDQDVEGLCYDPKNNRLLLAIKEKEPDSEDYKGIYAVDTETMEMNATPVFKLQFDDPIFEQTDVKNKYDRFMPSEISIHPKTGNIYMLEGRVPKLLILDSEANPEKLYFLNVNDFEQPEGLTFDPSGNIYLSNEGNPGNIHHISIN